MNVIKKRIIGILVLAMLVLPSGLAAYATSHNVECNFDEAEPHIILPYKYWRD